MIMAKVEMEPIGDRLRVSETLRKATKALETHRLWMKKRSRMNAVNPMKQKDTGTVKPVSVSTKPRLEKESLWKEDSCWEGADGSQRSRPTPPPTEPLNSEKGIDQEATCNYKLLTGVTETPKRKYGRSVPRSSILPLNSPPSGGVTTPAHAFAAKSVDSSFVFSPPVCVNAWGSQSSLDSHTSLELTFKSSPFASTLNLEDQSHPVNSQLCDSEELHPNNLKSAPDEPTQSISQLDASVCNLESDTVESSKYSAQRMISQTQQNISSVTGHVSTIIPVSPAPCDQRSSFSAHKQSKLMVAEKDAGIVDIQAKLNKDDSCDAFLLSPTSHGYIQSTSESQHIPDSMLQPVQPKQDRCAEAHRGSYDKVSVTVGSSSPPGSFTADKRRTITINDSNFDPVKSEGQGSAASNLSETTLDSEKMEKLRALEDLNLPPLKSMEIDGNKLVRELPPLKVKSPLLTPLLKDVTLLSKHNRLPPPYTIHRPQSGLALAPPCPVYGIIQPPDLEVFKSRSASVKEVNTIFGSPSPTPTTSPRPSVVSDTLLLSVIMNQDDGERTPKQPENLQKDGSVMYDISTSTEMTSEQIDFHSASTSIDSTLPISQLPSGPGPLHLAAKSGNLRQLQLLVIEGHDVDLPDHEGRTPLMYCVHSEGVHLSCADALIREGANVNKQTSDGSTALHLAASVGAVSLMELMLLNGANPDIADFEGRLPLHWSTVQKSIKSFTLLVKHSNSNLNVTDDAGMTPLMWAAYNNNPVLVSFLLEHGADCEEKDMDGYTAMHWAVHRDSTQCLQLLLKPDMTYFKDHKGRTVLHLAAEKGAMGACDFILKLRPDAIYDTDKKDRTPLHYASTCSRVDVCALLLDHGCDASQKDTTGRTPLDYARMKKLDYVVALLTCHSSAVADFARASRSASVSSFLTPSLSFSQLPLADHGDKESSQTLSRSFSLSNVHQSSLSVGSVQSDSSVTCDLDVTKGGYLGRFTNNRNDPVQHFYFWLNPSKGTICWSRFLENASRNFKQASLLKVHHGASNTVKQSMSYSPSDLHKYVFYVVTGNGVLDLFAYNQDSYNRWMEEIEKIAKQNELVLDQRLLHVGSRNHHKSSSRPASSQGRLSRSSIAPMPAINESSLIAIQASVASTEGYQSFVEGSCLGNGQQEQQHEQALNMLTSTPLYSASNDPRDGALQGDIHGNQKSSLLDNLI